MKRIVFISILFFVSFYNQKATAQNGAYYSTAAGIRLGYPTGVTFKYFISHQGALEGMAGYNWLGWGGFGSSYFSGFYEHHFSIDAVDGLQLFAGGGGGFYFWNAHAAIGSEYGTGFSVDLIGGIDYKISNYPINLSLDWKPAIFFNVLNKFHGSNVALSIRYVF